MKKTYFLSLLLMTLFSTQAFAVSTIKAEVNGMVCAFCAKGIEKKLKALPQSQAAFVDLKSRIVLLELKDQQEVALDDFKKIIQEAGYSVNKIEKIDKPLTALQAEIASKEEK